MTHDRLTLAIRLNRILRRFVEPTDWQLNDDDFVNAVKKRWDNYRKQSLIDPNE